MQDTEGDEVGTEDDELGNTLEVVEPLGEAVPPEDSVPLGEDALGDVPLEAEAVTVTVRSRVCV